MMIEPSNVKHTLERERFSSFDKHSCDGARLQKLSSRSDFVFRLNQ